MNGISAIVITKNEESRIKECLTSVSFCDEVIIIDANSSDNTVNLAREMGAKIYTLNTSDFSELRNFGLEKAKEKWILYVDADERVSKELAEEIKKVIKETKYLAFRLKRKNFYLGNHEWPYIERLERLFQRQFLKGWKGKLHESPLISGEVGQLEGFLIHFTHRNLSEMVKKTIEWSKIEADLRFKAGHPKMAWWRFFRVMLSAFVDSYVKQGGWKAGTVGLIESMYQSFSIFVTYSRLWEMQRKK